MSGTKTRTFVNKLLVVSEQLVPSEVSFLFLILFKTTLDLIRYVCKDLRNTDSFHLTIPINDLGYLVNDPVYRFPQVSQIDVICDSVNQRNIFRRNVQPRSNKLLFFTWDELIKQLEKAELDRAIALSRPVDRIAIEDMFSLVKRRVCLKKAIGSPSLSPIVKQSVPMSPDGLSVSNIGCFPPACVCLNCKLIRDQTYRLRCEHTLCSTCFNIRKSCATCPQTISTNDISLIQETSLEIQSVLTCCVHCQWKGSYKDYPEHLEDDHYETATCIINNQQNEETSITMNSSSLAWTSLNGTTLWKICGISHLREKANSNEQKSVYSAPFYSSPGGYRMCLRLFINGDCLARNTHMSLFVVMMRGEHDEHLQWPAKFTATFTLINQLHSDNNKFSSFWSEDIEGCFQKPTKSMNVARGIPKCFSLEILNEYPGQYILDDTIFIKTQFDFIHNQPASPSINGAIVDFPNEEEHVETTEEDISDIIFSFPGDFE